jgi:predicted O-methyltransferase YrrM
MIFADRRTRRFIGSSVATKIHELFEDSATFDYGPYHDRCDIVFVDGAHSFQYVESDTKAALRLLRPSGLIVWHDFNDGFFWPDVHKYLNFFARHHEVYRIRGTMFAVARKGSAYDWSFGSK